MGHEPLAEKIQSRLNDTEIVILTVLLKKTKDNG